MHRHRNVLTVRDARIPFQPIRSLCQREVRAMRDSADMDDIAAQYVARTFVRTVMFSYTMYYTSVPVVGCDRSCHLACFQVLCTIKSSKYQQPMVFIMYLEPECDCVGQSLDV
jgi:hypothetical protein